MARVVCGCSQRPYAAAGHEVLGMVDLDALHERRDLCKIVREALPLRDAEGKGKWPHGHPGGNANMIKSSDVSEPGDAERGHNCARPGERVCDSIGANGAAEVDCAATADNAIHRVPGRPGY